MRPFDEIPLEEWRRVMDVNVASMFLACRAVVPRMREQGGGKIVNISSGTPFRGVPFLLHYVTSKGAIVAFTRALAKELGKDGILVNCVAPGFTMSAGVEAHPEVVEKLRDVSVAARTIQRDQVPEDVVGAAVFLCGPELGLRHRPDDRDRRRPVLPLMRLSLYDEPGGVETEAGNRVVYDLARNEAHFGAARVDGPALRFELEPEAGAGRAPLAPRSSSTRREAWLMRCDRVDFPPGGVAYRHTHPGPGIRCLLARPDPDRERRRDARATGRSSRGSRAGRSRCWRRPPRREESAFVRVMLLPREWEGRRTISYVDPADAEKPKTQRATVYFDEPIEPVTRTGGRDPRRPARAERRRARLLRARRELPAPCSTRSTTRRSG